MSNSEVYRYGLKPHSYDPILSELLYLIRNLTHLIANPISISQTY